MAWIVLSESDVETALAGGEMSAYTTAALGDGQDNPLPEQLARVTKVVRGYVAACNRNQLGPAGTIPEELEDAAVALIAHALAARLPLDSYLTDRLDRRKEDAERLLRDAASCKFAIEQPTTGTASTEAIPSSGSPHFRDLPRRFTREQQEGI